MSNLQANRTLSGSFAEVWVDGARIAELSELSLTVKVQREKVQFGMDVDSKITGYSGEGTMVLKQVYTRFYEVLEQAKNGIDKRCTITTALKDPDAADGMEERYSVNNVAFTELPFIGYKMGEVNQQKLPFTFEWEGRLDFGCIRIEASVENGVIRGAKVYTDAMDWQLPEKLEAAILGSRLDPAELAKKAPEFSGVFERMEL